MTAIFVPLLATLGPAALLLLCAVVFAETGLLVGFFLPGDSLLFAAGLLVATGTIPVPVLLVVAATWASASVGDQVAYTIGRRYGPRLFDRRPSRLFSPRHVSAARAFFDRHGHKAVILARFVPLARTFTPVVAGAVAMPRRRFTAYNVLGGLAWTTAMTLAGFYLGGVPLIAHHVEVTSLALVGLSLVPAAIALARGRLAQPRVNDNQSGRWQEPAAMVDHDTHPHQEGLHR
ncbi:DedA family protein [Nocardioides sp. P86]|uniref:DedA family protein n=1 Tax=Nocardioides sp. P86 TaxID=2939569 RepID=UPI00203C7F08|nr:VTT domain-containing protein [Nocardioides sp. P86]MCM3515152.1 VTT domain-containing protein [Nocardioides sp. P86]